MTGCTVNHQYLTPAIYGQLLDQDTNKVIVNKGNIFTLIKEDGSNIAKTDQYGNFYVDAIKSKHLHQSVYKSKPTTITFNIEGYKIKRMNYNEYQLMPKTNSRKAETTLNMGQIYLEAK